jgi:hypothetical protein
LHNPSLDPSLHFHLRRERAERQRPQRNPGVFSALSVPLPFLRADENASLDQAKDYAINLAKTDFSLASPNTFANTRSVLDEKFTTESTEDTEIDLISVSSVLFVVKIFYLIEMTLPPVRSSSTSGLRLNTALGVPAAAHNSSYCSRSSSM